MENNELIRKIDIAITDVSNAYKKILEKGGEIPSSSTSQTTANLAASINSIPAGGGAVLNPLTATFTTTKKLKIYTSTPSAGTGYGTVSITTNVSTLTFADNINLDNLTNLSDYIISKNDEHRYIGSANIEMSTKFRKQLEFNKQDFENNIRTFSIPVGFNTDNGIAYLGVNNVNADNYTAACLMTNINPILYSNLPEIMVETNGISFRFIDYKLQENNIAIIRTGYKYVSFSSLKMEEPKYSTLCSMTGELLANCKVCIGESEEPTVDFNKLTGIDAITHYRICTDINIYMPYYNDILLGGGIFKSCNLLNSEQKAVTKLRINSFKDAMPKTEEFIQTMKDIIYEVPVRISMDFDPAGFNDLLMTNMVNPNDDENNENE